MNDGHQKARPALDPTKIPGATTPSAIEPMMTIDDVSRVLACDRRTVERLRSSGKFPKPDLMIGTGPRKSPRWNPETIRRFIGGGGL